MGLAKTASRTGLLLGCGYVFRDDVVVPEQAESPAMARGTRVHEAIEHDTELPDPSEQAMVLAAKRWLNERDADHEVAFAWDGTRSYYIGTGREAYANAPEGTLMTGTADVIVAGAIGDTVADWKSGDASKAGPQLATLAMMADAARSVAVEIGTGEPIERCDTEHMPWDHERHAANLLHAIHRIPEAEPTPGDHCADYYCPLRGTCPAYLDAAEHTAELVPAAALVRRKLTAPLVTPEDVAHTLPLLEMVEAWLEVTRDKAKEICAANGGEIRIDDSSVWRKIASSSTKVNGKKAFDLARKLGASQEELAALTYVSRFDTYKRIKKKVG